jgi:hypothetical protein
MQESNDIPAIFPPWIDTLKPLVALVAFGIVPVYVIALVYYAGAPRTLDVGYRPVQPVPYSHALHVGQLGLDCRYCHTTVEVAANAAIPPTEVCMNCHTAILPQSEKLVAIRESYATGMPVRWVRVHDLADFVYFDHSAHVTRGVGCVECHGRVDTMDVVYQAQTLSMAWCLDCHRNAERTLRPVSEVTNMRWVRPDGDLGRQLAQEYRIRPSEDCSTCHR